MSGSLAASAVSALLGFVCLASSGSLVGFTRHFTFTVLQLTFVASVPALGVITYFVESSAVPSRTEDKSKAIPAAVIANVATYKEERRSYDKTGVFDIKTAKYPSSISLENDVVKVTCEGTTGYLKVSYCSKWMEVRTS